MAKARGFTISIGKMDEKTKMSRPSGAFGDDYNRLLAAATAAFPALVPLLPPSVRTYEVSGGGRYAELSVNEIDAFCEQIYQLIAESPDAS
jgi:hypothetical protein